MKRARIIGIVLLVVFLGSIVVKRGPGTVVAKVFGDGLTWRSMRLSGLHAVDCGRVGIGEDPRPATACALNAQHSGKPFRIRYDIQGIDSSVAGAIVRTPEGKVIALSFDGDPYGGGGTALFRQRVGQLECPTPVHLWVNPKGRINCFQQQLSPPSNIMAPNWEPY